MQVAVVALLILLWPASAAHAAPELDQTFSGDGVTTLDLDPDNPPEHDYDIGRDVAIDPQGRVLVAGGGPGGGALVRYEVDGSLDESLAGDGQLLAADNPVLEGGVGLRGVALQPDGKILISTLVVSGIDHSIRVVRLNDDGTTDESFSNDGVVRVAAFPDGNQNLAVLPDGGGKIVVSGTRHSRRRFVVARFDSDGARDKSFGQNGISVTRAPGAHAVAHALAVDADGDVVVSGVAEFDHAAQSRLIILRLTGDGTPDQTFSGDGWREVGFERYARNSGGSVSGSCGYGEESGVAFGAGGQITLAGNLVTRADETGEPTDLDFAIARLRKNGDFDKSFSGDGRTTVGFGNERACAHTVARLPGGRTVVSGSAGGFGTAVLSQSGRLVNAYSGNGHASIEFGRRAAVSSSDVMPDGRFVVAGSTYWSDSDHYGDFDHDFAVARYDALD